jgi:hypothetical protein
MFNEPIEEGFDVVENHGYVSCLTITLSLTLPILPTKSPSLDCDECMMPPLDIHHFGYQPPLPITELQQQPSAPSHGTAYAGVKC